MNDHPMHSDRRERMAEAVVFVGHGKTDGSKEKGIERFARIAGRYARCAITVLRLWPWLILPAADLTPMWKASFPSGMLPLGFCWWSQPAARLFWNRRKIIRNSSPLPHGTAASLSWRRWENKREHYCRSTVENMIALTGIGYDIHSFAEIPRPLMLGGVHIPSSRGLDGHSDADVLCHAIADALLGAAGFRTSATGFRRAILPARTSLPWILWRKPFL